MKASGSGQWAEGSVMNHVTKHDTRDTMSCDRWGQRSQVTGPRGNNYLLTIDYLLIVRIMYNARIVE